MLNIAKILTKAKGLYSSSQNYDVLDLVQSGQAIYQSKQPNNQGHAVTDTDWWYLFFDLSTAIAAATNVNAPQTSNGAVVARLMAVDTNGQMCSITPLAIVQYVIESLLGYDLIARDKPTT